jgi:hypothetical protein
MPEEEVLLRISVECMYCQYQLTVWEEVTEIRLLLHVYQVNDCPQCGRKGWILFVRKKRQES